MKDWTVNMTVALTYEAHLEHEGFAHRRGT